MKKIETVIRQEKFENVRIALEKAGCPGVTVYEVQGYGQQKGVTQQWRGEEYKIYFLPKIKLEIIVKNQDVDKIANVIIAAAKTGEVGDGKVFISTIDNAIKIRTGEKGDDVI